MSPEIEDKILAAASSRSGLMRRSVPGNEQICLAGTRRIFFRK
jgi:hypothetical protein